MEGGLRTAENEAKTQDKGNNDAQFRKFPEARFRRQDAYFSDFSSHESVPEAQFCGQAACFNDFLKKGSPGVSKGLPGHHFQLQLYQQTPDPAPSAAVTCMAAL